jgi:O-antigen ligase
MHSKDDIRWQMYQDSMPLFTDHPLFGVGYRSWAENYPKVMDEKLAGTNPVYLHSDPLQILIETGLIGITPLVLLSFYLLLRAHRCARKLLQTTNYLAGARILGLSSGLLAALIGSCFDFPFRMGAISFYFAALLGTLAFYLDKQQST